MCLFPEPDKQLSELVFRFLRSLSAIRLAHVLEDACMSFQFALFTRAGTDYVVRMVRVLMELDSRRTLVSIDGVGAFDHMKRKSMLEALYGNHRLQQLLPFVRQFYGKDSEYVWYDDLGVSHCH